jgi:hypothetical protein
MSNADINPQVAAGELADHPPRVLRRIDALPDEQPRIGSFATGLAKNDPRSWRGKQMVGERQSGRVGALSDEPPRIGSFATGLANDDRRVWNGRQMVGDSPRVDGCRARPASTE